MSEHGGLYGIWEDLNNALKIGVDTYEEQGSQTGLPIVLKFVISNSIPDIVPSGMDIVFEGIELAVGVPPNFHIESKITLKGGESFYYEHRCKYSELPLIRYTVKSSVNPAFSIRIATPEVAIPATRSQLSLNAYLKTMAEINLHKWTTDVIARVRVPGVDTTLGQIREEQKKLNDAVKEISGLSAQLNGVYVFIQKNDSVIRFHQNTIAEYFREVQKGCGELNQLLGKPEARTIEARREHIIRRLNELATTVDEAIKKLK